eukprot:scaffold43084_cov25-Tisochrysis_lutea.AAC.3
MAAVPTALSYDKWSRIEGASSDEGEEARPLLGSSKSVAHHQADEQLYEAIKARFKAHFKGFAPLRQRKLLSRFAALQHRGVEPSNTYRYADIIGIVTQRHDELMDKSCVELLCKLHKELLKQVGWPPAWTGGDGGGLTLGQAGDMGCRNSVHPTQDERHSTAHQP